MGRGGWKKCHRKIEASKARQGTWDFLPRAAATWEACDGGKTLGTGVGAEGKGAVRKRGGRPQWVMGPGGSRKKYFAVITSTYSASVTGHCWGFLQIHSLIEKLMPFLRPIHRG